MAQAVNIPVPPTPSQARAQTLIVFNGIYDSSGGGTFTQEPYVEIVLRGCTPILDSTGKPVLNAYGQPEYTDSGWVGDLRLSPAQASSLMQLWEQVQSAAYQLFAANASGVVWSQQEPPPPAPPPLVTPPAPAPAP